ncbi:deleted in malignant brain tumors 1 protein-like [Saccostrea cucullata]|uniref:deleted in malignant brain tumors 1 protein-like n=1 Tax=Saccostrea cuccullata TaxID=36930 RepID=UPI002ED69709
MDRKGVCLFLSFFLFPENNGLLFHGDNTNVQSTTTIGPLGRDATLSLLVQEVLDLKAKVKVQEQEIQTLKNNQKLDSNVTSSTVNQLMSKFLDLTSSFNAIKQEFDHLNNLTGLQVITQRLSNMEHSIRYLTLSLNNNEIKDEKINNTIFLELSSLNRKQNNIKIEHDILNTTLFQEQTSLQTAVHKVAVAIDSVNQTLLSALQKTTNSLDSKRQHLLSELQKLNTTLYNFIKPDGIRLGGGGSNSGRVEVRFLGTWGTVCDDAFDNNDAKVVCRMLGKSWTNAVAYGYHHFGQGSGPIIYDDLGCTGDESDLFYCPHNVLRHHNCGHSEDAGVSCG